MFTTKIAWIVVGHALAEYDRRNNRIGGIKRPIIAHSTLPSSGPLRLVSTFSLSMVFIFLVISFSLIFYCKYSKRKLVESST